MDNARQIKINCNSRIPIILTLHAEGGDQELDLSKYQLRIVLIQDEKTLSLTLEK